MALVLTSGPAVEPVTLDEVKAHLRIDGNAEDVLLSSLILTSRLHVEAALDIALIDQTWTLQLDRWPKACEVEIPLSPLHAITSVRVKDASGNWSTVPPTSYLTDVASRPARLIFNAAGKPVPGTRAAGIEIAFSAGFGGTASSVPAPLRHAINLLVAHWYEHRDAAEAGSPDARIPPEISDLIAPFRKIRL